jgi:hypothetical protein
MIAVVIPTNRPDSYQAFLLRWEEQFRKHNVDVVCVHDGDFPTVSVNGVMSEKEIEGRELVANKCAGVRNLGFLYVAQHMPEVEYIVTLDDDMSPNGDTIGDHIATLQKRLPISWFSHSGDVYMRGFPYGVRQEAPVMVSHGIWLKNPDYDAPTQLLNNNAPHSEYYRGAIPKGAHFNFCGMSVAFKRKAMPYVYYAPVSDFKGAERFDDIIAGLWIKRDFDRLGWAIATGYASCIHERESNVFFNLEKEAVGIRHLENLWKDLDGYNEDKWFDNFREKRVKWHDTMKAYV